MHNVDGRVVDYVLPAEAGMPLDRVVVSGDLYDQAVAMSEELPELPVIAELAGDAVLVTQWNTLDGREGQTRVSDALHVGDAVFSNTTPNFITLSGPNGLTQQIFAGQPDEAVAALRSAGWNVFPIDFETESSHLPKTVDEHTSVLETVTVERGESQPPANELSNIVGQETLHSSGVFWQELDPESMTPTMLEQVLTIERCIGDYAQHLLASGFSETQIQAVLYEAKWMADELISRRDDVEFSAELRDVIAFALHLRSRDVVSANDDLEFARIAKLRAPERSMSGQQAHTTSQTVNSAIVSHYANRRLGWAMYEGKPQSIHSEESRAAALVLKHLTVLPAIE